MHLLVIATVGLLVLACLIPTRPSKRVSRLSEEEREAWLKRDRLAWIEKEQEARMAQLRGTAPFEPGGFNMDD